MRARGKKNSIAAVEHINCPLLVAFILSLLLLCSANAAASHEASSMPTTAPGSQLVWDFSKGRNISIVHWPPGQYRRFEGDLNIWELPISGYVTVVFPGGRQVREKWSDAVLLAKKSELWSVGFYSPAQSIDAEQAQVRRICAIFGGSMSVRFQAQGISINDWFQEARAANEDYMKYGDVSFPVSPKDPPWGRLGITLRWRPNVSRPGKPCDLQFSFNWDKKN